MWPPPCGTSTNPVGLPLWWMVGFGAVLAVGLIAIVWRARVLPEWRHGRGMAAVGLLLLVLVLPHPVRYDVQSNCSDERRTEVIWLHWLL